MSKAFFLSRVVFGLIGAFVFSIAAVGQRVDLENDLKRSFGKFDLVRLGEQAAAQKSNSQLSISILIGERNYELNLTPRDLRAARYRAENTVADGVQLIERSAVAVTTFKGVVGGESESQVRLTIDGEEIEGYFSTGGEKFYIESAKNYSRFADKKDSIVYQEKDLLRTAAFVCESELVGKIERGKELIVANRFQILPTYRVLEIAYVR